MNVKGSVLVGASSPKHLCRGGVQLIDVGLVCKLCWRLGRHVRELIKYERPE